MSDPELLTLAGAIVAVVIVVGTLIMIAALNAAPITPRPRAPRPPAAWDWDASTDLADITWTRP